MKNKKGFTLVELLGVLVVLTIIIMIAYPLITTYVNNTKQKSYDTQMEILLTNLKDYASDYKPILPKEDGEYVIITLGQLKSVGVIKDNIINPLDGKVIEDSMEFKIIKEGTDYIYEILENSVETRNNSHHSPTIELIGSPLEYYDVGDTYIEKGYKGYDYNGNEISVSSSNNINMSANGIYNVTYTATDSNGISSYVYRTVIVGSGYKNIVYKKYENGETVYFNPTTGLACSYTDAVSTTGTKEGCMKWYAFLDNEENSKVKLLLDHNTTDYVAWNTNSNGTTPDTVNAKLQEDITNWNANLKSTARLISAAEVNQIAPTAEGYTWSQSGTNWYYFQTGNQNKYTGVAGSNTYAWLFDNTNGCETYGCNTNDSGTYGYWTSSFASSNRAWYSTYVGRLRSELVDYEIYYGVRPVIEVEKSVLNNTVDERTYTITFVYNDGTPNVTKSLAYGSRYGELPTLSKEGYDFFGWGLSNGIKIDSNSVMMIQKDHTVYAQWKKIYTEYNDGTPLLYDPVNNVKCETSIGSTTGTNDGCMKWYVFLDDKYNEKVKLILDHNTTDYVAWNASGGIDPDTVRAQLQTDITNWNASVKSTARLIRAAEVNQIAPKNGTWHPNNYNTWYYLHDGSTTSYTGAAGTNNYAWLFDNTYSCETYGCNKSDNGTYGYWTSSFASMGRAWFVYYIGNLGYNGVVDDYLYGVRPVIEVPKSIFE